MIGLDFKSLSESEVIVSPEYRESFRLKLQAEEQALKLAAITEMRESRRNAIWRDTVDELYREGFDDQKMDSRAKRASIQAIHDWSYGPKGLWIVGESGLGKTRAVCTLVKRMVWEDRSVQLLEGPEFSHLAIQAQADYEKTKSIMKSLCGPDMLVIDDLGKRSTPATWQTLFALYERRSAQKKPVIVTTNMGRDVFRSSVNDDQIYLPLTRRIKEFSEVILA